MPITSDEYRKYRQQGLTKDQILAKIGHTAPAATAEPEARPDGRSGLTRAMNDFNTGVFKGAAHTAVSSVGLVQRGLNKISEVVTGKKQTQPRVDQLVPMEKLAPNSTAQKTGYVAEQIAEFFLPGGVTKATRETLALTTAPDIIKILGKGVLGAGESAAVTAAQGGTDEQTGKAARTGLAFDIASGTWGKILKTKTAQEAVSWLSEKIPSRIVNSILKPGEKAFHFGKNPGLGVVEEGITANTRGDLLVKIAQKKHEVGQAIETALNSERVAGKVLDVTTALAPIDDAIKHATASGEKELVRHLLDLKDGLTKEYELVGSELIEKGTKNLKLVPAEVQKLKIQVGQSTRWTGQAFDGDLNKVRVNVYRNLDGMLDGAVDGMEKLNSRYANLLTAEKSLEKTNNQIQRLVLAGLKVSGFGGLAASTSLMQGDSGLEAIMKGVTAGVVTKAAGSVAVKSRVAKVLNSMAPDDQEAMFQLAPMLRNIVLGVRKKGSTDSHEQDQDE